MKGRNIEHEYVGDTRGITRRRDQKKDDDDTRNMDKRSKRNEKI
jgi:hypothetical protein